MATPNTTSDMNSPAHVEALRRAILLENTAAILRSTLESTTESRPIHHEARRQIKQLWDGFRVAGAITSDEIAVCRAIDDGRQPPEVRALLRMRGYLQISDALTDLKQIAQAQEAWRNTKPGNRGNSKFQHIRRLLERAGIKKSAPAIERAWHRWQQRQNR